jgi:hypothetical protein
VVAVLVGDEDGVESVEGFPDAGEQFAQAAGGEAGVDEDARVVGLQEGGVAAAAGAENAEPHCHAAQQSPARAGSATDFLVHTLRARGVRTIRRIDCRRVVCPLGRLRRPNAFHASAVIVTRPVVAQQKRT